MLNPDYEEILSIFADHEVAFLMVGAYAMAGHGFPRATGDMDLWVEPTPENATRVYESLVKFGVPIGHFKEEDFAIDGVTFEQAWANRVEANIDGVIFPVLSLNDLITNKRATGRKKDALDAEWLAAAGK